MTNDWIEINEGVDRQRDFAGDLYAQIGPEGWGSRWSWMLLRSRPDADAEELAWGRTGGPHAEAEAKTAAEQAAARILAGASA
jgi:hypothetical protein